MSFYFCHGGSRNGFKLSDSSAMSESEKRAIKKKKKEQEEQNKSKKE